MIKTNRLSDKTFPLEDKGESLQETDDLYHEHADSHDRSAHTHVHSEESLRRLVNRLSRIEGHIRGIKTMVQESQPCPDVLVQIAAVRGALDRVARIILDEHLTQCIARAAKAGNIEDEIEELKAALDRFLPREKKADKTDK
ncbi:metal-sensing transcriptional repressor [Kamptonema formosum]|uniref:metal-sensing transcriptional repressor n=1 Tax=Kamptonema formosum TaxID=331992 RepID=UPI00034859E5|nr:metal-sensitive transcriptional regulator [Oscillatoria sp. PCC 10802]